MRAGHAVKISFSLKGLALKTLLSRLIIYLFTALFVFLCARGVFLPILKNNDFQLALKSFLDAIKTIVRDFFSPEVISSEITTLELYNRFMQLMSFVSNTTTVIKTIISILCVLFFSVFCASVCDYVIAINVNNYMTSLTRCKFLPTLIENFANALKYGLFMTITLLIYNGIVYGICELISLLVFEWLNISGVFFISLIIFITLTLRFSLIGHVLPKMICEEKGFFKSLFECISEVHKDVFKLFDRFGTYFLVIILTFAINVVCAIVTFFVSLLVTLPLTILIFSSIKFVGFYVEHKKKYFITYDEIYVPKELRKNDENLLNEIDI